MDRRLDDLALSTSWCSQGAREVDQVLEPALRAGFSRLELEYRITSPLMARLKPELRPRGLTVGSLHNYCPLPPDLDPSLASGDLFNLASLDKGERARAVTWTTATLELAADLEAGAVVLHLGGVEAARDREVTKEAARSGELTPALAAHLETRAAAAPAHLDAVSFSLERLIARAEPLGVGLGLENRFHAFQLPDIDETGLLLERFRGAPLGPWFDIGHAYVQEQAGLGPALAWLERYGPSLLGCHLHDAVGIQDHQPPGAGDIDLAAWLPFLLDCPLKVIELHPGPEPEAVREAALELAALLAELGARRDEEKEEAP